jgi:hypothetical protein
MFELIRTIQGNEKWSSELQEFIDSRFHAELVTNGNIFSEEVSQKRWGENFVKGLPKTNHEKLYYITQSTTNFCNQNYIGRVCIKYVWKEFFRAFPLGCILLVDLSEDWFATTLQGERDLVKQSGFTDENASPLIPQGMSGLQAENFPLNILPLIASGIYPLTLIDFIHTSSDLVFIYVPDRAISHAQMLEKGAYSNILWRLQHIFDDKWTFRSSRGFKSSADDIQLNPVRNIEYFVWFIKRIDDRMKDIVSIVDPLRREQLCMTFTRAVCDCILSITSQLPYMAKVFFFACLDKLCNLFWQLGHAHEEIDAWDTLTNPSFLGGNLISFIKEIPGPVGEHFQRIIEWSVEKMRIDKVTPEVLRDLRNSHHGYKLKEKIVTRLFTSSGELDNDTTMIATPLVIYMLGQKWK